MSEATAQEPRSSGLLSRLPSLGEVPRTQDPSIPSPSTQTRDLKGLPNSAHPPTMWPLLLFRLLSFGPLRRKENNGYSLSTYYEPGQVAGALRNPTSTP